VEDLSIVSIVPGVLVLEKEKFNATPTASFSYKYSPTLGEKLKLIVDGLSVVVDPLSMLPPEVFNPKFPPTKTCAHKLT
jgi:hypothetical protein